MPCADAVFTLLHAAQEPHSNLTAIGDRNLLNIGSRFRNPGATAANLEYTQVIVFLGPWRAGIALPWFSINGFIFNTLQASLAIS